MTEIERETIDQTPSRKELTRRQKAAFGMLVTILGGTVVIGALELDINSKVSAQEITLAPPPTEFFGSPEVGTPEPPVRDNPELPITERGLPESIEDDIKRGQERTYYREEVKRMPGCLLYAVNKNNWEIESDGRADEYWDFCGEEGKTCYMTTYQQPPNDGACTIHYIISDRPIKDSRFAWALDPEELKIPINEGGKTELSLHFKDFSDREVETLKGQALRALGVLGLVWGSENIRFEHDEFEVVKADQSGYLNESATLLIKYPETDFIHELTHGVLMPFLKDYPGFREGVAVFVEKYSTGHILDQNTYNEPMTEYDERNTSELREGVFEIKAEPYGSYEMAGEAVRRLEEQRPGFLRDLSQAYQDWLRENDYELQEPLEINEFEALVNQVWPDGGWEAVNDHHILFAAGQL